MSSRDWDFEKIRAIVIALIKSGTLAPGQEKRVLSALNRIEHTIKVQDWGRVPKDMDRFLAEFVGAIRTEDVESGR